MAAMCGLQDLKKKKKTYIFSCLAIYPYYRDFYASFWGFLDQFDWHFPFPVAHFGWWKLISEAISAG